MHLSDSFRSISLLVSANFEAWSQAWSQALSNCLGAAHFTLFRPNYRPVIKFPISDRPISPNCSFGNFPAGTFAYKLHPKAMIPWRQALHTQIVETLVSNRLFQRFAVTTEQKIQEFSGKGVKRAQELQDDYSNPDAAFQTKEKILTVSLVLDDWLKKVLTVFAFAFPLPQFVDEFKKELKEGAERSFGGKR
ncbi:hypothetical protein DFS34DRAFT_375101 [Phlyctochytrium arcticum]|nr:hypothetical protein DFS34DRAFT_375101 [Phlyctochytrium arcticum]